MNTRRVGSMCVVADSWVAVRWLTTGHDTIDACASWDPGDLDGAHPGGAVPGDEKTRFSEDMSVDDRFDS